jgi:anti-sigma factor RsiW
MPQQRCPSRLELRAFHLGMLVAKRLDAVAEHLETCARCEAMLRELDTARDPLLAALHGLDLPPTPPQGPQ